MLKEKIKNKEKTIGMHLNFCDIGAAKITGLAGYDFIWIDMEHSYLPIDTLLCHIITIKAIGTPVIVRVPQDDLTVTKKVLEMGVDGIIFPMVKSSEEANRLISMTLYPPYGTRGFGPINAIDYGVNSPWDYVKSNHETMCRFIQIEHKDAIEDLDKIMKNDFIDGYIFGPNDLSGSYNKLGDVYSEDITDIIKSTVDRLHKAGKYVGLSTGDYSDSVLKHWHDLEIDMLSAGADFDFLRDAVIANRKNLEKIHKF